MAKKSKPTKKPKMVETYASRKRRSKKAAIERANRRKRYPVQSVLTMPPEPESMTEVDIETEKKLSAKIIVGKRIGKIDAPKDLFTVIGIATGTKTGQSNYGEWTGLRGQFEVTRCEDGKVLQAPLMILPDAAMAALEGSAWPSQFAFLVRVVPSMNGAGFEYEVVQVVPPSPHDPLSDLRRSLFIDGRTGPKVGSGE